VLPRLARALKRVTGVEAYNVLQNNGIGAHQAVFHVHFHVIPKPNADTGLGMRWPMKELLPETGRELAKELVAALDA
jgi:histidine triad (HIT) family protein